ncbi:hypothetical protein BDV98DRAFT_594996 [Pterulicium gracile]|uniref:F-box domain-containing protein n=1 Tax=Pterulicium gracile TaxID=1884261 RepID=A0A5C3QCQ1_9AGAR|nr:hypothetical protein BDV98DRAFT_594996 [Pterula gracilis]
MPRPPPAIFRLPSELLHLIFQQVDLSESGPDTVEIGNLAAVCKRWTSLALASSGLWSTINVNMKELVTGPYDANFARLICHRIQLQLVRSLQRPLRCFANLPDEVSAEHSFIQAIIFSIGASLDRCTLIMLHGFIPITWKLLPMDKPPLIPDTLSIRGRNYLLQHLALMRVELPIYISALWTNIRTLELVHTLYRLSRNSQNASQYLDNHVL